MNRVCFWMRKNSNELEGAEITTVKQMDLK